MQNTLIDAKCKFCGLTLSLKFSEDYSDLGDPWKLKDYAACNRCADYKEKLRVYKDRLGDVCRMVQLTPDRRSTTERRAKLRESIVTLTHSIDYLVTHHYRVASAWENEFVDLLMDKPEHWPTIIYKFEQSIVREAKHKPPVAADLPYAD